VSNPTQEVCAEVDRPSYSVRSTARVFAKQWTFSSRFKRDSKKERVVELSTRLCTCLSSISRISSSSLRLSGWISGR